MTAVRRASRFDSGQLRARRVSRATVDSTLTSPPHPSSRSQSTRAPRLPPSAAPKSSAAIGASAVKSAAEYAAAARDLEAKANEALAAIRDDAKLEAILADAKKPKPTTEPGRLMRRAENAKARAEAEARKEEDRAAKAAAKEAERAKKEAEKAAKEAAKEEEKRKKEAERAAKEAAKEAEKAAKEEEKRKKEAEKAAAAAEKEAEKAAALAAKEEEKRKKEEEKAAAAAAKEAAAAAEKAAKEAAAAARAEREAALLPDLVRYLLENPKTNKETATNAFCESRSVPEFELAKTSIRAKISDVAETRKPADRRWEIKTEALAAAGLTAEQAEAMRPALELTEEEKARERKRAEAAEKEAARKAEEAKAAARKAKQANAFKGFFAAAPKKRAVPEPAVTAPPAPAALDAAKEEALIAAVAYADADDAAAAETRRRDMLATWRNARRGVDSSGRWGQRRAPKRARGDGASSSADAALRAAMEASVAASGAAPRPKRRTLISVDCSSEYEESSSYRFGFQLGVDQLDGPHELRKTFPVPGGRPAYWGSGVPPGRPGSRSAAVTGRRPFARDPETEYEVDGALFDSGDEWEEEEEGENLDDSDADGDDEDERADRGEDEDDKEGFVVPDGYLSEEENAKGDDEILADADDAEDAEDGVGLGLELERGVRLAPAAADDARAKRDRARAELTRWMDRARRQNRPLVIAAFARDADGAAEGEDGAAGSTGAHLLQALAPARFRAPAVAPGTSAPPAIRMFRARRDGAEDASGAGLEGCDGGRGRRVQASAAVRLSGRDDPRAGGIFARGGAEDEQGDGDGGVRGVAVGRRDGAGQDGCSRQNRRRRRAQRQRSTVGDQTRGARRGGAHRGTGGGDAPGAGADGGGEGARGEEGGEGGGEGGATQGRGGEETRQGRRQGGEGGGEGGEGGGEGDKGGGHRAGPPQGGRGGCGAGCRGGCRAWCRGERRAVTAGDVSDKVLV